MRKCPRCETENNDDAFRCKNEDCLDILPQGQSEEKPSTNNTSQENTSNSPYDTKVNPKRLLQLLLGCFALFIVLLIIIFGVGSCEQKGKEISRKYEAEAQRNAEIERQHVQRVQSEIAHANEYWGKRYEDWELSAGKPPALRGRRGELGLTPIHYPTLGITVIVNDDNQIIKVEETQ